MDLIILNDLKGGLNLLSRINVTSLHFSIVLEGETALSYNIIKISKAVCDDGWMDDLQFYVLFNSISVISGRCVDDNKRPCAMEPCLRLRRFRLEQGSNLGRLDQYASP